MQDGWGASRRMILKSGVGLVAAWKLQRAAAALGFSATGTTVCNTTQEQEVGPYYVADEMVRANIREGKAGFPLTLRLMVLDSRTCKPLRNAAIDAWHCDALGLYAGFTKTNPMGMGPGGPPPLDKDGRPMGPPPGFDTQHPGNHPGAPEGMGPPPAMKPTDGLTFLRGIQFTDDRGRVEFSTVFPGFYMGRVNHIHFKVREGGKVVSRKDAGAQKTYIEGHTSHIGQVFFPEEMTAKLMEMEPYSKHKIHRTTQAEDGVFQGQHGAECVAKVVALHETRPEAGYVAELVVAVNPEATPKPVAMGGPPPRS